jgi:hypothetical protein
MTGRLTAEELDAAACEWAERTALAQGLPAKIEDPAYLAKLATFMNHSTTRHLPPAGSGRTAADPLPPGTAAPEPAPSAAGAGRAPLPAA